MAPSPGGSPGLLQRRRPTRITLGDVRQAAAAILPLLATPQLRLTVVDRGIEGPVVVLEEGERRIRAHLGDLAEDMADAGVPATPAAIAAALSAWVAARPVSDAATAATGMAVLDWTDPTRTAVGWRVVVGRGELAVAWTPSPAAARRLVVAVREAALGRARAVEPDLRVEGPVAVWSHPTVPALATAALAAPERMLSRMAAAGLRPADLQAVLTPNRPVACAGAGIAARLAGNSAEACVRLPWERLPELRWI